MQNVLNGLKFVKDELEERGNVDEEILDILEVEIKRLERMKSNLEEIVNKIKGDKNGK